MSAANVESPAYLHALRQQSVEPDIYFDDPEEDEYDRPGADSAAGARIVISMLLQASGGNLVKLQALMCVFAGMTLREAAGQCGKSHEYVRLQIASIEEKCPHLHTVLVDSRHRYKVPALIPMGSRKWTITNKDSNRTVYTDNLRQWCRDKKAVYHKVRYCIDNSCGNCNLSGTRFTITRNY